MEQYDIVLDILKTFEGHAGRKGLRGGSVKRDFHVPKAPKGFFNRKSVRDAESLIYSKFGITCDYGYISSEQANDLNKILFDIFDKKGIPDGLEKIEVSKTFTINAGIFQPYTDGTGKITLFPLAFKDMNEGSYKVETKLARWQEVLAHELGHSYSYETISNNEKEYETKFKQFAESIIAKSGGGFRTSFGYEKVKNDIPSVYGMTNKHEFMAESFVQAHYGTKLKLTDFQKDFLGEYA